MLLYIESMLKVHESMANLNISDPSEEVCKALQVYDDQMFIENEYLKALFDIKITEKSESMRQSKNKRIELAAIIVSQCESILKEIDCVRINFK
jgi:hypothetical protein